MVDAYPTIRAAGLLERYHITRCQLGLDSCIVSVAKYVGQGALDLSLVYAALGHCIEQLGSLGVQVEALAGEPRFVRLPSIHLPSIVTVVARSQSLEETIAQNLSSSSFPFGTNLPLWRLLLLSENTVLFAYCHAIGDGQSGLAFHQAFFSALNELASPLEDVKDTVMVPADSSLPKPVEKLTDTSVSVSTFLHTFFELLTPISWRAAGSSWTGNSVVSKPTLTTNVRSWSIPASEVNILLLLCREHKTTLTAAFHTLAVIILSRLFAPLEQSRKFKTITTAIPVSLRRYTGIPADAMVDAVSAHYTYAPIIRSPPAKESKVSFPWETAAQFAATLRKGMKRSREVIGTIRYLYSLGISERWFLGMLGKKRGLTVEISNLGVFDAPQKDDHTWKIGDVYFGQCDAVCGAAMKINVVGSPSGTVNLVFTWGEGAMDGAIADAFIEGFGSELISLVSSSVCLGVKCN